MQGDELDRILDEALASYARAEPRAGLPQRVMARVRSDAKPSWRRWLLLPVGAALVLSAIAVEMWPGENPPPPPLARLDVIKVPRVESGAAVIVKRAPRREPSPRPPTLTSEERALLAFARVAPEAALQLTEPDKPVEIEPIDIRPLKIDGLQTGETK